MWTAKAYTQPILYVFDIATSIDSKIQELQMRNIQ